MVPAVALPQTPANFSGTWKMDPTRSESAHQAVPTGPVTLVIAQTADEVSIETRAAAKDKKAPVASEKLTYKLDGSESGTTIVCRARWDGSNLITNTIRNVGGSTVTTHHVLSLDSSGKELTIQKTLMVQHGYEQPNANNTGTAKDVFVKAK